MGIRSLKAISLWNVVVLFVYIYIFSFSFLFFLPMVCNDWYYSAYFEGRKNELRIVKYALELNDKRTQAADDYFSTLTSNEPERVLHGADAYKDDIHTVDIAIGIITINRHVDGQERAGYLTQTAAAVHSEIRKNAYYAPTGLPLFICNVDHLPMQHDEARQLEGVIKHVRKFGSANATNTNAEDKTKKGKVFEKEKEDYSFCMQEALKYAPKYVLLLEDDAPPVAGFFRTLKHILDNHVLHRRVHRDEHLPPDPWLMLKLYYPDKWAGFSRDVQTLVEVLGAILVGGSLFVGIHALLSTCCRGKQTTCLLTIVHFTVGALFVVGVVCSIGRPYLLQLRSLSTFSYRTIAAKDCCTQGVLFPADRAREVVPYLASVHCDIDFSIDLALDKYAEIKSYVRHLVQPNMLKHIGMVSTVRAYAKSAAEFLV